MDIISRDGDQLVTVAEAKANSRITSDVENDLWTKWIKEAHSVGEHETNLVFQLSTCRQTFEGSHIDLHPPVRGIISVVTYDDSGVETQIDDYKVTRTSGFGLRVTLATKPCNGAAINYVAGFGPYVAQGFEVTINGDTIQPYPEAIDIILTLTNDSYQHRGSKTDFEKFRLPDGIDRVFNLITKEL